MMIATKEEIQYLAKMRVGIIEEYVKNNTDPAIRNNGHCIGIISDGEGDYVWTRDNLSCKKPQCSCGETMVEQSIFDRETHYGYPLWICSSAKCLDERNARVAKELISYREKHGLNETIFNQTLAKMNIPEGCYGWTLAKFDNSKARNKAREAIKNKESLFLTGHTGVGKTHLAIGLLIDYGHNEPNYYQFISVPKLILELHNDIKEDKNYTARIKYLETVKTLVLDDIGAEKTSEYVRSVLYELINSRLVDNKQTIITSNLSLQAIGEKIDERLASRISSYTTIVMSGADRRKRRMT